MFNKTKELEEKKDETLESTDSKTESVEEEDIITLETPDSKDEASDEENRSEKSVSQLDSTSTPDTESIALSGNGFSIGDSDLNERTDKLLRCETHFDSMEEKLTTTRDLLYENYTLGVQAFSDIRATFTLFSIRIGRLLLMMKAYVRASGKLWEPWADENLSFIKERTRQKLMRLAAIPEIEKYHYLGNERLHALWNVLEESTSPDPIGDFEKRHNLPFEADIELDLDAYKQAVDLAVDSDRISNADVEVDKESILKYKKDGKKITDSVIKRLKDIKDSNGDPDLYLTAKQPKKDPESPEHRIRRFKNETESLIKDVKWLTENTDLIKQVDVDKVDELTVSLVALKKLTIPSESPDTKQ
jgi:hypothetical protein